MKMYSLQEVLETENVDFKTKSGTVVYAEKGQLYIKLQVVMSQVKWACPLNREWLNTKFIKAQESVNFTEVINSSRKCKVEHKNVTTILENKDITFDKHMIAESFRAMQKDEYLDFDSVMLVLSRFLGARLLKQVITDGKWYLEESEVEE